MMCLLIGREFEGRAHCGLDDARNISFIVQRLLQDGARVVFNEKIPDEQSSKNKRRDGTVYFSAPVYDAEFKSLIGNHRPNYPRSKKSAKA